MFTQPFGFKYIFIARDDIKSLKRFGERNGLKLLKRKKKLEKIHAIKSHPLLHLPCLLLVASVFVKTPVTSGCAVPAGRRSCYANEASLSADSLDFSRDLYSSRIILSAAG